ncbi:MAG: hypothetical protein FWE57_06945 [Chitinispirillia bacterium]|nr:hypothetical protein [Chitinispirillia bacterium]
MTGEFTAGPNPVARSSGKVDIFRQGRRIDNTILTIYDASGNVVNKIAISDRRSDPRGRPLSDADESRRIIGSWDLKNAKGRPVSEGTYLVRGVITIDGKKERVSLMICVK